MFQCNYFSVLMYHTSLEELRIYITAGPLSALVIKVWLSGQRPVFRDE